MTTHELKNLTRHIQRANAALTALSNYRHDGRPLPGQERTLAQAIAAIREAGRLVDSAESSTGSPDPRTESKRKDDPAALQWA